MRSKRLLAAVLGSAMVLTFAGAVLATDLHQATPISIGDELANTQDCTADELAALEAAGATVAWHFILTNPDAATGHLWARFTNATDETTVEQWKVEGNAMHFYIYNNSTTLGDTDAANDPDAMTTDVSGDQLNLSHTCMIEETSTPSPSPSPTEPPVVTPSPTLPPTTTAGQPSAPAGNSLGLVLATILLIAGGLTAFTMRPRRSTR